MSKLLAPDYGQQFLLPPALEDWVPPDHPARFIREWVEALDLPALGFVVPQPVEGRPPYAPSLMLKICLYGYLHRVPSTRKLEAACRNEMPLLWLCGLLAPDHNSLWRFWRDNQKPLRAMFKQSVQLAVKAGLVGVVLQALDGTKIAAVASGQSGWSQEYMEKLLAALEQSLAQTEAAVGAAGPGPAENGSGYRLPETVAEREALRAVVQQGLAALAASGRGHYHPKEPQARRMKCEGRTRFAYNAQAVINRKERIVTAAEVTDAETDEGQLVPMVKQARANTGQEEAMTVTDTAYGNGKDLAAAAAAKLSVISPVKEGSRRAAEHRYHAHHFRYEAAAGTVTCPQGRLLEACGSKPREGQTVSVYRCRHGDCAARAACCGKSKARMMEVWPHTAVVQAHRAKLAGAGAQAALRARGRLIEWLWAVIKEQVGFRRWSVRGLEKVRTQWALICAAVNLRALLKVWARGALAMS